MAVYYKWDKHYTTTVPNYNTTTSFEEVSSPMKISGADIYYAGVMSYPSNKTLMGDTFKFNMPTLYSVDSVLSVNDDAFINSSQYLLFSTSNSAKQTQYYYHKGSVRISKSGSNWTLSSDDGADFTKVTANTQRTYTTTYGQLIGSVYSISSSTYPSDGVSGSYYYRNRTTVTSPTSPGAPVYPETIATPNVTVSWNAASSNTDYPVSAYELEYLLDGGGDWISAGSTSELSKTVDIPPGSTSIQFRVRAKDTNGQYGSYTTGAVAEILLRPVLTVPSRVMEGDSIPISWSSIDGADSYNLQRKVDAGEWETISSGADTSYTDTAGAWSTVQYQAQAVIDGEPGEFGLSDPITVIPKSTLVISGRDEDLGVISADIPYTVNTDTSNPITLTRTVNGQTVAVTTVQNGFSYSIPVLDLPTGSGTIEITASVNTSGGSPVTATRSWTYTKTPVTFPNTGGPAQLAQGGQNVFPPTLAEAVRVPAHWGGSLDKALEMLLPLVNSAVIQVGTYEGTGTFGVDNPSTLTFSQEPVVVTIYGGGQTLVISSTDTGSTAYLDGKTAKWYADSAAAQMNTDGTTYRYVAVGKQV